MGHKRRRKNQIKYVAARSQLEQTERLVRHPDLTEKRQKYSITDSDRITWIYTIDTAGEICEVTCVGYQIEVGKEWVTVVYFDNTHDKLLHRHIYISLDEYTDTIDT